MGKEDVISDPKARALFIQKMGESEDIKELRVLRSKGVDDGYPPGLPQEYPVDEVDIAVLASGSWRSDCVCQLKSELAHIIRLFTQTHWNHLV